jgi:menaquinone-dependent protoporphyrinogen oxidase
MTAVLVAYATKYGSTQEIAGVVAEALRERGLETDVRPARDVSSLDGYSAVVLGAALYMHRWHRDVVRFVSRHHTELARLPVAVFAVGPVNDTTQEFGDAREQLDHVMARWEWLSPASVAVFGGRFDPARLRFPGAARLLSTVPATDIVDPAAIGAWAHSLPEALALDQVVSD